MKKICRALNIRKHKFVVFIDAYTSDQNKRQLVFDKEAFLQSGLKNGDCFAVDTKEIVGKNGQFLLYVNNILWISPSQNSNLGRTVQVGEKGYAYFAQENARNGGEQIKIYQLKRDLIKEISKILEQDNFESVKCNVLEPKQTASAIVPFKTKTRFNNEDLFLRITPENQLKQMSAILLKSVFTIDNTFYNKQADAKHQPEFCTLEFLGLDYTKQDLLKFITHVSQITHSLCEKYGFETDHPKLPEIINYSDLEKLNIKYQRRIPEFKNTILTNVPVDSPFIHQDNNGMRTETRWYLNGSLTGHGYEDEINTKNIKEALQRQKQQNKCTDVNEMSYFDWGLPKSVSFGLGIDALVCRYLNLKHMSLACNPLGINYTPTNKQQPISNNAVIYKLNEIVNQY